MPEERMTIASMKLQGASTRAIARVLARPASTVSRELRRNSCAELGYASDTATALQARRRRTARPMVKLDVSSVTWGVVLTLLSWKWSPQQIAATLRRVYPDEPQRHVSHETIYTAIYAQPRGELRRQLIACLRQGRSTRLPRSRGTDRRGQIPDMVSIHVRPPEIDDRVMPGHWEGDFIKGTGNKSSVGVLVERSSRLVLLARMEDATAAAALAGFTVKLNAIAAPLRQSLTYDQGKEMARHAELAANTGVRVYFCDPHSPWQRGTCENTNGLLRQYLPKGTDLSVYTQQELDAIADSLNTRPRATHNWRTPLEVFAQTLASSHKPSTSVH
ncbi:IS30 family transposase [Variovorax sp. WS11]|uniref:IS30 family transposase n=1 Tax=Variovorax sp. WS11 TaxID=1105204 RepID=UPI000D0DD8C9|nr:IS30 family transposase [Variovorax sp. WS11]NDZ15547.1 IS30 family transposase [Variovorax sp. WS11]NDZ17631.1 IS30 family transposase [Variovorax sp. WS11]NDZ18840.1 IS30 family transposase [Variovorax sp. WS11]PSL78921.1 IS30 family transposase [Variovorax sp. WS11]